MTSDPPIGEDDLQGWIDDRLPPSRRMVVHAYLAAHPETMKRIEAQTAMRSALREALAPVAEEPIPARLRVADLQARRRRPPAWWQAAAAAVLLAAGFGGGWGMHDLAAPPRAGIGALASEAAASYRVYASDRMRPVEIAAGEQTMLVRWMSDRLGSRLTVPDLGGAGFTFLGGRLVATPHGPAALFVYENASGVRLATLVRPMEIDKQTRMTERDEIDLGNVSWADAGMGYSLVGSQSAAVLHLIADEVRRQIRRASQA